MRFDGKTAKEVKIAYIGGGSRGWAWLLMSDLVSCPQLSGDVYLYDIDFQAVNILLKRNPELTDRVFDTLTYFHVNNMVSPLKVPVHFTLGLSDPTCLPEFVYSFYHHTNSEKEITIAPFTGHNASEGYLHKVYTEFSQLAEGE